MEIVYQSPKDKFSYTKTDPYATMTTDSTANWDGKTNYIIKSSDVTCPTFGNGVIKGTSTGWKNRRYLYQDQWVGDNTAICSYDDSDSFFSSTKDVDTYVKYCIYDSIGSSGSNTDDTKCNQSFYNKNMSTFCGALVTSNCPNTETKCLRYSSLNDEGQMCRSWASEGWKGRGQPSTDRQRGADSAFDTWCQNNPTMSECACINAGSNDTYKALKNGGLEVPDYCWYTPCTDSRNIGTFQDQSQTCPKDLCQTIINTAESQSVDYSNLKLITTCSSGDDTSCPSGCKDSTCMNQKCVHCESGTPDSNGKCSAAPTPGPSPAPAPAPGGNTKLYIGGSLLFFIIIGLILYISSH
jgi:hypothetical protein